MGTPKIDYNNIIITFGSNVKLYDGTNNRMKSGTVGTITLRASNEYDSYYVMSLRTGRKLTSSKWTKLPIPDEVIHRVHDMSRQEQQPNTTKDGTVFEWDPEISIDGDVVVIENNIIEQENNYDESENISVVSNDEESILNVDNIPKS